MPALQQYDYDYYEYASSRRGVANAAPRVSMPKDSSITRRTSASNTQTRRSTATGTRNVTTSKTTTTKRTSQSTTRNNIEIKTKTTRDVTRNSIRAVTRTENVGVERKKPSSKNIQVSNAGVKRNIAKPKELSLKNAKVMAKPKVEEKQNVFKTIAFSFFAFSILFLICYRSALINESFNELGNMKNKLEDTKTLNAQLESDIQTQTDLSYIETYAKYQLGMQKPKESQIRKIVVEKEDKISTPVTIEKEEKTFFDNLINDIVNILD